MDLREGRAWVYLRAIVEGQARLDRVEALRLQHARALSLYAPDLDQHGRQQLAAATDRVEAAIERELRPWAEHAPRLDTRALEAQWEAAWGKLDSPEMAARIAEACRGLAPARKPPLARRTP